MNKKILLVGGGGHCKSVIDSLLELRQFSKLGIIDKIEKKANKFWDSVYRMRRRFAQLFNAGYTYAFVTVGSIGNPNLRIKLLSQINEIGFEIPAIIDPTAIVSRHANIGKGVYVGKNAVINSGTVINQGAIINSGAIIEHDCKVGEFVHVASGAVLCGEVQIGNNTHIGAGSVIKQQVKIGANSIIGMGSVVLKDIKANIVAYGNPCKEVE